MIGVPVKHLLGVGSIPLHRSSASRWLAAHAIDTQTIKGNGGEAEVVRFSDLPAEVRRAYELREIEASGLPAGDYDDAAHERFAAATPAAQAIGLRKAEIARFLVKGGAGRSLPVSLTEITQKQFGPEGTDRMTLRRILRAVDGVDPVNFAPALLPGFSRSGRPKDQVSPEAWAFFMTVIRDAAPEFPLKQAWRDARDVARTMGWNWPPYRTVMRRWDALPEAQKLAARHGRDEAISRLEIPIKRDKTTLRPLEIVSLDGRTLDFWVDFGDGKAVRPVMLALVDTASNYVLGYEIARSENAVATARLIRNVCQRYGIFDRLYTDNGSAFAGHLVAGGAKFKWRGKSKGQPGVKPLGVCYHLGIELTFAIPKNAKAKIAERTFAALSRVIDDRPEFKGAHAGHAPGAAPGKSVRPVPLALMEKVIRREIDRHNHEEGRTGQGAAGRSYEQVFRAGMAERIVRKPTSKQIYYAGLIYTPASVDRWGQVHIGRWTYGDISTQQDMLAWHGKDKEQILVGRDPDNFDAPAVAFDHRGHLICKDIIPVRAGAYDSVDGAREAAKQRKSARAAVAQAEAANGYLADAAMQAALAALGSPAVDAPAEPAKVTRGKFGGLQPKRRSSLDTKVTTHGATLEMLENFDRKLGIDWSRYGG